MKITSTALAALAAGLMVTAAHADFTYQHISIDTTSLVSAVTGPYSLDFSFLGNLNVSNNATLSGFAFLGTGAGTNGAATITGTASGDMGSTITLSTGANVFNDIYQGFTAGTTNISFNLTLSTIVDPLTPDNFTISILDGSTNNIATTANDGITLTSFAIDSFNPTTTVSASTSPASVTVAVPEPSDYIIVGLGVLALVIAYRRRQA